MSCAANILITGITGFLGRHMLKYITDNNHIYNVIGIANSEKKIAVFSKQYANVKVYKLNLTDSTFRDDFDKIIKLHNIDYVIHNAAMKFVDVCEENPICALNTNTIASAHIIDICSMNKIKNLICLSTDKSNTPFNVYGMSKNIMERMALKAGYSVYQGANFFGSDGSVLDIWFNQMSSKVPLSVTDKTCIRYFTDINSVCKKLLDNIDTQGIILPDYVYKIPLSVILEAFCKKFNFYDTVTIGKKSFEKDIEELDPAITNIIEFDVQMTSELLDSYFDNNVPIIVKQ